MLLRKRAEEMVELMEKTKAELTSSNENINGEVYIGCGVTDAISFLAQAAQNLQKKHPLIHYHIYSGDAESVMERLDKGLIGFGLLVGSVDVAKYEYMRLPMKDTWGVLMRKDSPLDKLINTIGECRLCFKPLSPALESGLGIIWKKHQVFSRASNKFLHQLQCGIENK